MPDITMCRGDSCPKKDDCYRYTAKPYDRRQSYFMKPPYNKDTKECEYFWLANKK